MSPFWTRNITFKILFGIVFLNDLKSRKVFVFQYCSIVLDQRNIFPDRFFLFCFHICSKPLPGTVFRGSQCRTVRNSWFWVPFMIFWVFKKTPFEDHFGPQKLQKSNTPVEGERPFRDPAFHEIIVITVPLGPSLFQNIIVSMMLGYFSVFTAFLCDMFYM